MAGLPTRLVILLNNPGIQQIQTGQATGEDASGRSDGGISGTWVDYIAGLQEMWTVTGALECRKRQRR